ncbi:MAG: hypothetical protein IJ870_04840 [Alphaproteobacteria bacterium]|nr:hypothetical protein [Alphaproteobacteria bacterium]
MEKIITIIFVAIFVIALVIMIFGRSKTSTPSTFVGKAKLLYHFEDEEGCFLCSFEKDGKLYQGIYGFDKEGLKVGDEVDVVWNGLYFQLPHLIDKEIYDRDNA